ncbi:hypothetical protein HCN58_31050 [Bradyrhizobium sp. WSM 1791]|uniref:Uncharacterized protein n=1 Tax=Bradyrhizobium australiense TaxID=2721161 RepID=A0A7Y4LZ49_9BRAD|nr:hypothetical protein [Bradyrhizobium australiense]NOJ43936.1 hypothetical protein [Bradyrhizobium australiense]
MRPHPRYHLEPNQTGPWIAVFNIIAEMLKRRIVDIAQWTPFSELHVIFEVCGRADELIEQVFGDFRIEEDGRPIPVGCSLAPCS